MYYNDRAQLTEAQLRNVIRDIIAEEIEKGNVDEGIFNFMRAAKNTAAPDAQMIGRRAQGLGQTIKNAYGNAKERVGQAYNNAKEGFNARKEAMTNMYNSYQAIDKMNKLKQTIQSCYNLFTTPNSRNAADELLKQLNWMIGGLGHGGTQTQQQNNIRARYNNESDLHRLIRNSVNETLDRYRY